MDTDNLVTQGVRPSVSMALELALTDYSGRSAEGEGHDGDVMMSAMASQITSLTIIYSTVYSGADERKHQISAPLDFVRGIHRSPVNSPHKGSVTRKMFPFDDVVMDDVDSFDLFIRICQGCFNRYDTIVMSVK